jgi:hypothetical protein
MNIVRLENVHADLPICVLKEMTEAHGVSVILEDLDHRAYREKVAHYLQHIKPQRLKLPLTSKAYRVLAMYINAQEKCWTKTSLELSYRYLSTFQNTEVSFEDWAGVDFENLGFGPQTPERPNALNACVLYRLCMDHHIQPPVHSTIYDMYRVIWYLYYGRHAFHVNAINILWDTKTSFAQKIKDWVYGSFPLQNETLERSHHRMLKTLVKPLDPIVTSSSLKQRLETLGLPSKVYQKVELHQKRIAIHLQPKNTLDAILFAAYYFDLDLSQTQDPILEYHHLSCYLDQHTSMKGWAPQDEHFRMCTFLNPPLMLLSRSFHDLFAVEFYTLNALQYMYREWGGLTFPSSTLRMHDALYQHLRWVCLLETVYIGIYPEITNETTPIHWEELKHIPPNLVLCLGIRHQHLEAFHIQEWIDHFKYKRAFVHPSKKEEVLKENVIVRLKHLLQQQKSLALYQDLLNVIETIEFLNQTSHHQIKTFCRCYAEEKTVVQEGWLSLLRCLLDLGLKMRGWDGESSAYPIEIALVEDNLAVEQRSQEALHGYLEMKIDQREIIDALPLFNYKNHRYEPSRSIKEGYTISDRIHIVTQGNETENTASCIRMSSNWFVSTAYRYLTLLHHPPPFDIHLLRQIS